MSDEGTASAESEFEFSNARGIILHFARLSVLGMVTKAWKREEQREKSNRVLLRKILLLVALYI
jgi:hypothetical protein